MLIECHYTKSSSIKFNRCQRYVGLEAKSNKTSIKHRHYLFYCCVNFIFLSLSGQKKITYTTSSFIKKKKRPEAENNSYWFLSIIAGD